MYREGLRGVNLCFSTTDGVFSWLLRKAMKIPASHCVITFRSSILGKVMVMDAQGRGFVMVPWNKWERKNRLIARYALTLPDDNIRAGLNMIADRLGDAYDTWSLVGFFLLTFGGLSRNITDSKDKLVCSEAVALFLDHAGLQLGDIGRVTPRDLLLLAEATPDVFDRKEASEDFDHLLATTRRWGPNKQIHDGCDIGDSDSQLLMRTKVRTSNSRDTRATSSGNPARSTLNENSIGDSRGRKKSS